MRALGFFLAVLTVRAQTVFVHVNVFDGTRMLRNRTVALQDGVVTKVARPASGAVVEGRGKTLLPALIDAAEVRSSDWIQVVYDDGFAWGKRNPPVPFEALHDEVERVHKEHKRALVEVGSLRESIEALNADADGLLRIFAGLQSEAGFAKLAAKRKVFVVPMLAVLEGAVTKSGKPRMEGALEALRQLRDAHVPLLVGGRDLVVEMELLVRDVGMSPVEALQAATSVPARLLGIKPRGWVLVDGDPTVAVGVLRTAREVR